MIKKIATITLCIVALSACTGAKKQLGLTRQSPDEFAVLERAPLSLPPDYTLRPPRDGGSVESNTQAPQAQARRIVLGSVSETPANTSSSATDLLLQKAGAQQAQPSIRSTLDKETTILSTKNRTVAEKLLFFTKDGQTPAVSEAEEMDAKAEAERLLKQGVKAPTPGQYIPPAILPKP